MLDHLTSLANSGAGKFRGPGRTTDGFAFEGELNLTSKVRDAMVEISFRAADRDSAFHEEATWIANDLLIGRPALWTVSTNTPGVLRHDLVEDSIAENGTRRLVFRLGDPADVHRFRQEIALEIADTGALLYLYSWGVPHEPLAPRVRAELRPVQ
ncbi:MAG: hypothetical protein AAB250_15695 [Bdellovibrionota bacterium]